MINLLKIKQKIAATIDKIGAAFILWLSKRIYKWFRYLSFLFILIIIYVTS